VKSTKYATLILDADLYPRGSVDDQYIGTLAEALRSGAKLPPPVACAATKRIIDGAHRQKAALRVFGKDYAGEVIFKKYRSDADRFADAVRLNAGHGRRLSTYDRAHCLAIAERVELSVERLADCLSITCATLEDLRTDRTAHITSLNGRASRSVALKHTNRHLAGRELSAAQVEGNDRSGGMQQLFYVNQVINLLEHDLVDPQDGRMAERLQRLGGLVEERFATAAKS